MDIHADQLSATHLYHLMTQTVIPRPIAWVLTQSTQGITNLAPFSYFAPVASDPPLLMFSVGKKSPTEIKDTAKNAIETQKMVVHIASETFANVVTQTAATLPHNTSEIDVNNIALTPFESFELPRVKDASIAFGCELYEVKEIGNSPQTLIFAEIKTVYIADDCIDNNAERLVIDALKINPLSRLGGNHYATLKKVFSVERPK